MKREQVVHLVKVKLDELSQFEKTSPLIAESNNKDLSPIESYIEENLDRSFDDIKLLLPLHVFSEILIDGSNSILSINNENVGSVKLPLDYLRLHSFKLKTWERSINNTLGIESPEYPLQQNKYTRGGVCKPVIVCKGSTLSLYSASSNDTTENAIEEFKYIRKTKDGNTIIPDKLVEAVVLRCASKVCNIFEEQSKIAKFEEELKTLILTL